MVAIIVTAIIVTETAATIAVGATIAVRATKVIKVIAATGVTIATHEIIATINAEKREHSGKLANDPAALSNRSAMPVIAIDYVGVIRTKARGLEGGGPSWSGARLAARLKRARTSCAPSKDPHAGHPRRVQDGRWATWRRGWPPEEA